MTPGVVPLVKRPGGAATQKLLVAMRGLNIETCGLFQTKICALFQNWARTLTSDIQNYNTVLIYDRREPEHLRWLPICQFECANNSSM